MLYHQYKSIFRMTDLKVSFLGLGVMGYPMAGHLANAGMQVTVYNRTSEKAEKWLKEYDGSAVTTPEAACEEADIVLMCVGDDNDVRQIATRALTTMKAGAILVDHTTASADIARELAERCSEKQIGGS
jgi:3-hydroxyisobutyrate dehydrogenase